MEFEHVQAQLRKATQEWVSLFYQIQWETWWRRLPKFLEILFVVLLAKAAAEASWLLFTPGEDTTPPPVRTNAQMNLPVAQQPKLTEVANIHLFGIPPVALPDGMSQIEAAETILKLTLRGVFASNNPQQSMAIVADQQNVEKVYLRGETIIPGVLLYDVYPDRVILERAGNFEALKLDTEKDKPALITPVNQSRPAAPRPAQPDSRVSFAPNDQLRSLRDDLVNQPKRFWDQVRIDPVMDGESGQLKGYRFHTKDPQLAGSMGLTPNDIVVDVNGVSVTDPTVLQNLMNMQENQTLNLGVDRNGTRVQLQVRM